MSQLNEIQKQEAFNYMEQNDGATWENLAYFLNKRFNIVASEEDWCHFYMDRIIGVIA